MSELTTTDIEAVISVISSITSTTSSTTTSRPTTTRTARAKTRNQLVSTITKTHYVTSTITASPNFEPTATEAIQLEHNTTNQDYEWEHKFIPILLAFSIIGILTVIGSLIYLTYRLFQAYRSRQQKRSRRQHRRRQDAEEDANFQDEHKKAYSPASATLSHIIPWLSIPSPLHTTDRRTSNEVYINHQPRQQEPIRYEKADLNRLLIEDTSHPSTRRPSLAPSWLIKMLAKGSRNNNSPQLHTPPRHMSLPILGGRPTIDNLNVPISSTFKPIDKSSLVLVPRSEIWLDPDRRRGVDELDLWERKKSGITVVVAEEEEEQLQQPPTPLMWRFQPPSENAYPDSPESFERRFSGRRRSIHIDSRHSSTTTMQEILPPPITTVKKSFISRSKSESRRYDQQNSSSDEEYNHQEETTIASSSISYPNALNYYQEEDDEEDEHFTNFAITVKLPKSKQQQQQQQQAESSTTNNNDVRMVRQALETSRLKNSSSQWLHSSGSKSF